MRKKIFIPVLLASLIFFNGCSDGVSSIATNKSIRDSILVNTRSKRCGKTTYYYIDILKNNKKIPIEVNNDTYNALEDLKKSAKLLKSNDTIKLDIIYNDKNGSYHALGVAVQK